MLVESTRRSASHPQVLLHSQGLLLEALGQSRQVLDQVVLKVLVHFHPDGLVEQQEQEHQRTLKQQNANGPNAKLRVAKIHRRVDAVKKKHFLGAWSAVYLPENPAVASLEASLGPSIPAPAAPLLDSLAAAAAVCDLRKATGT